MTQPGQRALVRVDLADVLPSLMWATGTPLPGAKGRGGGVTVLNFEHGVRAVARDYRRGGALGFLLTKSYLDPDRPRRELELLVKLRELGVPTVTPLAALARKIALGLCYRLRLITELVPDALPLPAFLAAHPHLRRAAIEAAGRAVRLAFAAGLWHPDLHPDNLLARVAEGTGAGDVDVRLLDLDRAELRKDLSVAEQDRMLLRMARYLRRHQPDLPVRASAPDHLRLKQRFQVGAGRTLVGRDTAAQQAGNRNRGDDGNDRHHDHQFNQRKSARAATRLHQSDIGVQPSVVGSSAGHLSSVAKLEVKGSPTSFS